MALFGNLLALVLLSLCLAYAGAAHAQAGRSLKDMMFGKHTQGPQAQAQPRVQHFTTEDGEGFILDQSGKTPFLRFDGDDEIWALSSQAASKGDIVFRNDVGEPLLKTTRWGGTILFSSDRPMGDPAAVSGHADAFTPPHMSPLQAVQSIQRISHRVFAATGRKLGFEGPDVTPGTEYVYVDAADVTADALIRVALQSGRDSLNFVHSVEFVEGRPPSVTLNNGVLLLKLDVSRSWGGRPSSKRIINALMMQVQLTGGR